MNAIVSRLLQGQIFEFKNAPEQHDAILQQLATRQFSPGVYTSEFHKQFLAAISDKVTVLTLKNNPWQTDDELMELINRMPNLTKVILEGCPKISGFTSPADTPRVAWAGVLCKRGVKHIAISGSESSLRPSLLLVITKLQLQFPSVTFAIKYNKGKVGEHPHTIDSITVLPNGMVASASPDRRIELWNWDPAFEIWRNETLRPPTKDTITERTLLASLSNGFLASSNDEGITLWDVNKLKKGILLEHICAGNIASLPNGLVATSGLDGEIIIWNVEGGKQVKILQGNGELQGLAALPNGLLASTSTSEKTIQLWNVDSGEIVKTLRGKTNGFTVVIPLPNGLIAVAAGDCIELWNIETGALHNTLRGHDSEIYALTVLPDGMLASGAHYGGIRIWNVESGMLVKAIETDWINSLALLPNGDLAAASGRNINSWKLDAATSHHPMMLLDLFPTNLTSLDVSHTFITDEILKAILKRCPGLKEIKHDGCGWLTKAGIALIAERKNPSTTHVAAVQETGD